MRTIMKALLACMPATAVLAMGNTQVIEITAANMDDTNFHVEMGDTLEFHWEGPYIETPWQQPENMKIQASNLTPPPFSIYNQRQQCHNSERISMPEQTLAKYVSDSKTQTWKNYPHSQFDGVFTDLQVKGPSDWMYSHNRLVTPGQSRVEISYTIPYTEIKQKHPNAAFVLKSSYFGLWKMEELTIETTANGHVVHDIFEVEANNEKRVHHTADLNDVLARDEHGKIVIEYEQGQGELFLWEFEIVAEGLDQEISESCTWIWLVRPMTVFQDKTGSGTAKGTFDLKFTDEDAQEHLNSLTILYNH